MNNELKFKENILLSVNNLFRDGRCPHAVLVDGASEEERYSLAKLVAKTIVCSNRTESFCGECENCRKADENIHPDIITVEKPEDKKFFAKADVKKIVAESYLTPNDADKKVYIFSEIQQMTEESQNLLLKILEEPPAYTAFVLTSSSANAVIGTILSRVVRLRLGKTEEKEYSEKAVEVVKSLSSAVSSSYEYDKIKATAPLDGNKKLTVEVLELFIAVLRDAIAIKSGGKELLSEFKNESASLSEKNNLKKLLEMYDVVCGIYKTIPNNPNYNLLSAVLCARL